MHAIGALGLEKFASRIQFDSQGFFSADPQHAHIAVLKPGEVRFLKVYTSYDEKNFKPVSFLKLLNKTFIVARYSGEKIARGKKYRLTSNPNLSIQEQEELRKGGYYKTPLNIKIERALRKHLTRKHSGEGVSIGGIRSRNP
ncbi:MAG: hypothetical protein WBK55_05015 [Alphaproteobacteria bacterium]